MRSSANLAWTTPRSLILSLALATLAMGTGGCGQATGTPDSAAGGLDSGGNHRDSGQIADLSGHVPPLDMAQKGGPPDARCINECAGQCVDLQSDPNDCGACGNQCTAMQTCQMGLCTPIGGTSSIYCNTAPPAGSRQPPPPPKYSGGTCPMLVAGSNAVASTGHKRTFLLVVPANLQPTEYLPVVFMWYWLRGSSADFLQKGDVQNAVDTQRFLAVIPDAKGDLLWNWPFAITDSAARQAEEYTFFDDMLSCVSAQYNVNHDCVASAGVSAGALFTDQLAPARSQYLSSAVSLSGGVGLPGDGLVKPWSEPQHKLPMLVLWGGPKDICIVINFQDASHNLEAALKQDGSFMVECVHNCGHGVPPFTAPPGLSTYAGLWRFIFDHPYWLAPGDSPYKTTGLPADAGYPAWCAVGAGNAVPRTGPCPPPGC